MINNSFYNIDNGTKLIDISEETDITNNLNYDKKNYFTEIINLNENSYIKKNDYEYFLNKNSHRKIFIFIEFLNYDIILNVDGSSTILDLKKFLKINFYEFFGTLFDIEISNISRTKVFNNDDILSQNKNLIIYKKNKINFKIIEKLFKSNQTHRKTIFAKNNNQVLNNFNLYLIEKNIIREVKLEVNKKKLIICNLIKNNKTKIKIKNIKSINIGDTIKLIYNKNQWNFLKNKESLEFIKKIKNF